LPCGHRALGIVVFTLNSDRRHIGQPHPVQYPILGALMCCGTTRCSQDLHALRLASIASGAILINSLDNSASVYCATFENRLRLWLLESIVKVLS
jgi:hypothetical protein